MKLLGCLVSGKNPEWLMGLGRGVERGTVSSSEPKGLHTTERFAHTVNLQSAVVNLRDAPGCVYTVRGPILCESRWCRVDCSVRKVSTRRLRLKPPYPTRTNQDLWWVARTAPQLASKADVALRSVLRPTDLQAK